MSYCEWQSHLAQFTLNLFPAVSSKIVLNFFSPLWIEPFSKTVNMDCLHRSWTHARRNKLIVCWIVFFAETNAANLCIFESSSSTFVKNRLYCMQCLEIFICIKTFISAAWLCRLMYLKRLILNFFRKLFCAWHFLIRLLMFYLRICRVYFIVCWLLSQRTRLACNIADPKPNSSELNYIIEFCFIAKLAELTQRLPDFGMRRFLTLLVDLVRMINPVTVVCIENQRNSRIVI